MHFMNCHCISTAFQGFHTKEDFGRLLLSLLAEECQKLHNFKSAVKTLRRKNPKKVGKLRHFTSDLPAQKKKVIQKIENFLKLCVNTFFLLQKCK